VPQQEVFSGIRKGKIQETKPVQKGRLSVQLLELKRQFYLSDRRLLDAEY